MLSDLSDHNGLTVEEQLERIVRREQARRIGEEVSSTPPTQEVENFLNASTSDIAIAIERLEST